MSGPETYHLAHTARCKLSMAADRPDRNLRFILGHAFTLDKLMLRLVEIESESSSDDDERAPDDDDDPPTRSAQRVSFRSGHAKPVSVSRKRSPPPPTQPPEENEDEEEYADEGIDEDDEGGLSLRRFESASAKPPRMIQDFDGADEDEDADEPKSPPPVPPQAELEAITEGPDDGDLVDLYESVKRCPCHGEGHNSPDVVKAWDIPRKGENHTKRMAVVQVAA
ncbi:uncharacterized protein PAC_17944 [Phialocephala subalpina]|uniref:Uncharacterized protein n=1 Tax=Phialocephala subalpina TaxID=576137 RepID=A0A1L7XSP1_9HELO|nr:uncharacterized protein PAC_17944 [Phialocephala subalpina]